MCFAPQPCALFEQFNFQKFSGPGVPSTFCFVPWPHALFEQFNFQKCSEHDFSHFDLSMCFAPHPRALFGQLNFQKCSEPSVFLAFWLLNVLHATAAAQRPKVSRTFDFKTIGNSEIRFRNEMRPGDFRRHPPTVLLVTI